MRRLIGLVAAMVAVAVCGSGLALAQSKAGCEGGKASTPVKVEASLPCSRPPIRPVSPSRRRSVPVTLRVRNVGTLTGLSALPTLRSEPSRLNSAVSSIVMSPLAATRGVSVRFTPTLRYWKLVAGR